MARRFQIEVDERQLSVHTATHDIRVVPRFDPGQRLSPGELVVTRTEVSDRVSRACGHTCVQPPTVLLVCDAVDGYLESQIEGGTVTCNADKGVRCPLGSDEGYDELREQVDPPPNVPSGSEALTLPLTSDKI